MYGPLIDEAARRMSAFAACQPQSAVSQSVWRVMSRRVDLCNTETDGLMNIKYVHLTGHS